MLLSSSSWVRTLLCSNRFQTSGRENSALILSVYIVFLCVCVIGINLLTDLGKDWRACFIWGSICFRARMAYRPVQRNRIQLYVSQRKKRVGHYLRKKKKLSYIILHIKKDNCKYHYQVFCRNLSRYGLRYKLRCNPTISVGIFHFTWLVYLNKVSRLLWTLSNQLFYF